MKKALAVLTMIVFFASTAGFAAAEKKASHQCAGITEDCQQCKRMIEDPNEKYCFQHAKTPNNCKDKKAAPVADKKEKKAAADNKKQPATEKKDKKAAAADNKEKKEKKAPAADQKEKKEKKASSDTTKKKADTKKKKAD